MVCTGEMALFSFRFLQLFHLALNLWMENGEDGDIQSVHHSPAISCISAN